MPSKRMKVLEREILVLRSQFLPEPFDPLGRYADQDRTQAYTRAFLVLCHAEVESYLEDWAKSIARAAEDAWKIRQRISEPLLYLLASLSERLKAPATLKEPKSKDSQEQLLASASRAFQQYYKQIKNNNGVKEANLLALLSPIGVPRSAMTPALLPMLDSFGGLRGTHAHLSAKAVVSVLDPETEFKNVLNLIAELEPLDQWLRNYKQRVR